MQFIKSLVVKKKPCLPLQLYEALVSLRTLKGYIESKGAHSELMHAILQFKTFLEREVLISRERAQQEKVTDIFDSM